MGAFEVAVGALTDGRETGDRGGMAGGLGVFKWAVRSAMRESERALRLAKKASSRA